MYRLLVNTHITNFRLIMLRILIVSLRHIFKKYVVLREIYKKIWLIIILSNFKKLLFFFKLLLFVTSKNAYLKKNIPVRIKTFKKIFVVIT